VACPTVVVLGELTTVDVFTLAIVKGTFVALAGAQAPVEFIVRPLTVPARAGVQAARTLFPETTPGTVKV
jgi:hypothetical protein